MDGAILWTGAGNNRVDNTAELHLNFDDLNVFTLHMF